MAEARLHHNGVEYHPRRVVCLTVVPSFDQAEYRLAPAVESKVVKLVEGLGSHCRVSKFQWLVATEEPCGAITQDLEHEGVENVLVFSALVGTDWKFWCRPQGKADEWEFDGVAAFLQQHLGQRPDAEPDAAADSGARRLFRIHSSLGPAAAELHCSFAETMILRPGITSIFESHERGSLPEYSIADFRRLVYTVAASQDWRVASIAAAGITPNFHFAKLESPHRSIFILGHSNYPIIAFAKEVSDVDQRLQFVDESEISSEISRLFPDVAIAIAADLNRSITEDDLAQLAPIELRQVKYQKPCTIGQLAFNWWD